MESIIDWLNDIYAEIGAFFTALHDDPQSRCWVVVILLAFWLLGIILNWKWTFQPTGWDENYFYHLFGPGTFRFWHGVVAVIGLCCAISLLIDSYK